MTLPSKPYPPQWEQVADLRVFRTTAQEWQKLIGWRADMQKRGWKLLRGLLSFYLICSVGAVGNVGIAAYVFAGNQVWWLAGIAGAVVGSVWNYAVSSVFTWRRR